MINNVFAEKLLNRGGGRRRGKKHSAIDSKVKHATGTSRHKRKQF